LIYSNTGTLTGGGLDTNGTVNLKNVTFSKNTSPDGGGIYNGGTMDINNTTIVDNQSGIYNGNSLTINNTILAANLEGNCLSGISLISRGYNIDSGTSCGFSDGVSDDPSDLSSADPRLDSLADNGGPTQTYALFFGSPAIDGGESATCLSDDQRSVGRPIDGDGDGSAVCDIGAYETERLYGLYLPLIFR